LHSSLNTASELAWERLGGVSEQVLATDAPVVLESVDLATIVRHPRLSALSSAAGPHTAMVLPMRAVGVTVGVMALARTPAAPPYDAEDVQLAQIVADRIGLATRIIQLQEVVGQVDAAEAREGSEDPRLAVLSDREREIFMLIAEGLTSREIGERIFLSVRTVEWHRAHLMAKLGVSSRSELIALGRTLGP
jgi:DNA-binding CsgD family transcriptional regulator